MKRRDFLKSAAGAAAALKTSKADALPFPIGTANAAEAGIPQTGRAVVMTFRPGAAPNGQTETRYVFAENAAKDMGDYTDPFGYGVTQHCRRVINASIRMVVDFRPDKNGSREEIVVRYGMLPETFYQKAALAPATVYDITTPYTCDFYKDGSRIVSLTVPVHWWWAKWRWSKTAGGAVNAPRPVRTTVASLVAEGLMLNYKPEYAYGAPPPPDHAFRWPMGDIDETRTRNTGLTLDMGQVGGRGDIGPVTEWQANWMMFGGEKHLATVFAQAELIGAMPIHWIDDQTGALVDEFAYHTTSDSNNRNDFQVIPLSGSNRTGNNGALGAGKFDYDDAHAPAASWLPYLLTGDAYYLENLQAQATHPVGFTRQFTDGGAKPGTIGSIPGCVIANQHRSWAWGMRSVFQARRGSPQAAACPSWLKPQEYWKQISDANLTFVGFYMNSTAKVHSYFHAFIAGADFVIWQVCYIATVLAWAKRMGYSDWDAFRKWQAAGLVNFATGLGDQEGAGWPRNWPNPYYVDVVPGHGSGQPGGDWVGYAGPSNPSLDAITYSSYTAMAHDYFSAINGNPGGWNKKAGGATGGYYGGPKGTAYGNPRIDPYKTWSTTNAGKLEQYVDNLGVDNQLSWLGTMALLADDDISDTFGHANVGPAILAWGRRAIRPFLKDLNSGVGNQMRWAIATKAGG